MVGQTLAHYKIDSQLGEGGMGVVYLATDSRLGRRVAIKVLRDEWVNDPGRISRFEREARLLASLNHTNIAAIHGLEHDNTRTFLVLEYVPGETLAERIGRGALPLREALDMARQVAEALEAAHALGVIHRDLKPANIKITPDGRVKVLDFGLAKVCDPIDGSAEEDVASTATVHTERTRPGIVMGTVAYMSPEQASGRPVDQRTDLWAFGCVLFEMLTGRRTFAGGSTTEILVGVLDREPEWTALPEATPESVRRLLRRCLTKDPRCRLHHAADARLDLEETLTTGLTSGATAAAKRGSRVSTRVLASAIAALLIALPAGIWAWSRRVPPRDTRVIRLAVDLPKDSVIIPEFNPHVAVSPDGTRVALAPLPGPVSIRRIDRLQLEPLEASASQDFGSAPLFSPDGRAISFISGNTIISSARPFLKAAFSGGAGVKLAEYDAFHRGDWSPDGWIYWTQHYPGGIVRIRDTGGGVERVTELDLKAGERSHRFASLLPDGSLLYTVGFEGISTYSDARIDLWDPNARQRTTLIAGGMAAVYSSTGHIIYARGGKLLAVPFDVSRHEVTGSPFTVLSGVLMSGNTGAAEFALSRRGDLVYVPGTADGGHRTLVWVDRSGKATPLPLPPASYLYPRLSPDGRLLAFEIEGPNHDVYVYDFVRSVLTKLTTDGQSHDPVWTPDGKRIVFRSWQSGGMTMWMMPVDRSAAAVRLDPAGTRQSPVSVSPDGRFLAFDQKDPETSDDIWMLPLAGGSPRPVVRTRFPEGSAKFSSDGRWIAYASAESGREEVYVQAFPGPGGRVQISSAGGFDPVWPRSGRELYYRSDERMMAVTVTTSPELRVSAPIQLWQGAYSAGSGSSCGMAGVTSSNYDVAPDGPRFVMVRDEDMSVAARQVVIVLNWSEELRTLAQTASAPSSAVLAPALEGR